MEAPCCPGNSVQEVYALLDQLAEDSLADCLERDIEFDAPGSTVIIIAGTSPNYCRAVSTMPYRIFSFTFLLFTFIF